MLHGTSDDRCPIEFAEWMYQQARSPDKRLIILPGDHHIFDGFQTSVSFAKIADQIIRTGTIAEDLALDAAVFVLLNSACLLLAIQFITVV